jgi:mycofactocin precursor
MEPRTEDTVSVEKDETRDGTDVRATVESDLVVDELLVEDVSIDGMCGVY